jgi:hypothetical protein
MKTLTNAIGTIILAMLMGLPVAIFGCYVLSDISNLYQLPLLSKLSLMQFYGLSVIVTLLIPHTNKPDEDEGLYALFVKLIQRAFIVLIAWGMAYIFYSILS